MVLSNSNVDVTVGYLVQPITIIISTIKPHAAVVISMFTVTPASSLFADGLFFMTLLAYRAVLWITTDDFIQVTQLPRMVDIKFLNGR